MERQTMGAKESPRFGSGTLWGKKCGRESGQDQERLRREGWAWVPKMISEPPTFILLPTPALTGIQM